MPRQSRDRPWVVIFILFSLLAHLLFVVAIVLISHFIPTPKFKSLPQEIASTTLSLQPQPPPPPANPLHPRMFALTNPDDAKHAIRPIESDNDADLKSQSAVARNPDSLMPDIVRKNEHASAMQDAPNAPSKNPPRPGAPSSATGQQQQKTQSQQQQNKPSPQTQPQPQQAQQPSPTVSKQPKPTNAKTPTAQLVQQQLDPNGLPVLPPISAPTMAPASERQETPPASSVPEIADDAHGALGTHGDNSPAAMATAFGKYKAKVYRAVGSRWYPQVDKQFQILPVGIVHIQFTIHSDGTVDTKVLEGDNASLQILCTISLNAIRESAPFDPFPAAMIQELGGADSYTDDFTFSIYGGGQ
jgi:outer membrane biosynthesis protein TonB